MRLRPGARLYLWAVVAAAIACIALYAPKIQLDPKSLSTLLFLAIIAFFAEIYEIELTYKRRTSTAIAIFCAAIFLKGTTFGIAIVLSATLVAEIILRWDTLAKGFSVFANYVAFNVGQHLITVTLTGVVFSLTGGHPPPYQAIADFVPPVLAFLTYVFVNTSLVSGIIHLAEGVSFTYHLKFNLRHLHIQLLSLGVLAILLAVVYAIEPWYILLVLIPLALVHISLRGYMRLRQQAQEAFERMTLSLMERDHYTGAHSADVAALAGRVARALGLSEDEVDRIEAAARVHDLGKIAIPDEILFKEDGLTDEEWEVIKQHPVRSAELLKGIEIYDGAIEIIEHHHEHWDGSGYPDGLKGEKIPLGARILALADIYNALITDRPYRKAYTKEEALEIIRGMSGKELDPKVVEAFLKCSSSGPSSWGS
jgi:HD-GYP domain-containing protein (c-di-GMP phosphodiesterase class II)